MGKYALVVFARKKGIENMIELDYSFEKQLYFAEKEGRELAFLSLVRDGTITSAIASQKLGMSEQEIISMLEDENIILDILEMENLR